RLAWPEPCAAPLVSGLGQVDLSQSVQIALRSSEGTLTNFEAMLSFVLLHQTGFGGGMISLVGAACKDSAPRLYSRSPQAEVSTNKYVSIMNAELQRGEKLINRTTSSRVGLAKHFRNLLTFELSGQSKNPIGL